MKENNKIRKYVLLGLFVISLIISFFIIQKKYNLYQDITKNEIVQYNLENITNRTKLSEEKNINQIVKTTVYEVININTATKEKLMTLDGIGEKIANQIIDYRNTYGNFNSIDDLLKVKGIGKEKIKKLSKYIEV